jgi:hypothetical protein
LVLAKKLVNSKGVVGFKDLGGVAASSHQERILASWMALAELCHIVYLDVNRIDMNPKQCILLKIDG